MVHGVSKSTGIRWTSPLYIEIDITQNHVMVKHKNSDSSTYNVVLESDLQPTGYYGFGPFTSYCGHDCWEHSNMRFSDIRMTRISN